jgi:hypothetical protein
MPVMIALSTSNMQLDILLSCMAVDAFLKLKLSRADVSNTRKSNVFVELQV